MLITNIESNVKYFIRFKYLILSFMKNEYLDIQKIDKFRNKGN